MLTISLPNDAAAGEGSGFFETRFNIIIASTIVKNRAIETTPPPITDGTMIVASFELVLSGKGDVALIAYERVIFILA